MAPRTKRAILAPSRAYVRATWALLALGLILFAYPLLRAFYHIEIDYNEGWNGYLQLRAQQGLPLYSGYSPWYFNNYPPLSFHIVGLLGRLTGDVVLAGRLLSLAGLAAMALACGSVVRDSGGSREDARLASATCLLLYTVFATDYLGMNDPQLLGMGLATWGLALTLREGDRPLRAATAALLLAAAPLIKHNLALLPLLAGAYVLWRGPVRSRMAFVATAAACAALAAALIWLAEGPAFFVQFFAPREWDVARAFLFFSEVAGKLHAPLLLVAIGLFAARRQPVARLTLAWLVSALAAGIYFSGGAGTDINVWFDVMTAAAIGAGLVVRELRERGGSVRWQAALALAVNAGTLSQAPLTLGRFGVDATGELAESERQFAADVAWLKAIPGTAICESQLLCLSAGKPMFYDSFNMLQARRTGGMPQDAFAELLHRREVSVVQVTSTRQNRPDDAAGLSMPTRFANFEDSDFDALDREYRMVRRGISGRFFVPKSATAP